MVWQANTDPKLTQELIDSGRSKYIWSILYHLPMAARVAALHAIGWTEQSQHVDLKTRLFVDVGRSLFSRKNDPSSVAQVQAMTLRERNIPRNTWISKYESPVPPETGAVDAVMGAIGSMVRMGPEVARLTTRPEYEPIGAEWTAYRPEGQGAGLPDISEEDKYKEMVKDVTDPTTILYFHGGAYMMLDPKSHRPFVKQLCKRTGGRGYNVRYRLSPQAVFPAALLDAFVSYLTLLYPPPGAFHEPVKAEHIVVCGDSAGGNLAMSLLQLLLELRRTNVRVPFHGEERDIPLPAGVACNSPWLDITHSYIPHGGDRPLKYDIAPAPEPSTGWMPETRPDHIWPADPPRCGFYAQDHLVAHPLVSMVGTRPEDWAGAPPIYMCTGWEHLGLEARVLARRIATETEVRVVFSEYEALPHCFALIFNGSAASGHCFDAWAGFISSCVSDPAEIRSKATRVKAKTLVEEDIEFEDVLDMSDEAARRIFEAQKNSPFQTLARL